MKILMFGWEFPPHISGGLGTACYGLVKGRVRGLIVMRKIEKHYDQFHHQPRPPHPSNVVVVMDVL